jgi:hypothetical protein
VLGDVLGDPAQERVAAVGVEVAAADGEVEEDLEVDLVVGAVDAGRVVDEVGEDEAARAGELVPRALREAEVAALHDDLLAQLVGVDADRVARAVLGVGVGLGRGLDDGADPAVPEHVDGRA